MQFFFCLLASIARCCFISSGCSLWSPRACLFPLSVISDFLLLLLCFFFSTSVVCKPCLVKIQGISLSLSKQSFSVVPQVSSLLAHSGCCFSSNAERMLYKENLLMLWTVNSRQAYQVSNGCVYVIQPSVSERQMNLSMSWEEWL